MGDHYVALKMDTKEDVEMAINTETEMAVSSYDSNTVVTIPPTAEVNNSIPNSNPTSHDLELNRLRFLLVEIKSAIKEHQNDVKNINKHVTREALLLLIMMTVFYLVTSASISDVATNCKK